MNKREFLGRLRLELSGLPEEDIEERMAFLEEMIDDRIEEGLAEEDAVLELGSIDKVVSQIVVDIPLAKIVKERMKSKKRMSALTIVLLAVGSPLWLVLGIAAFVVLLSLYAVLWSLVVSAWAVFAALAACALAGLFTGVGLACGGHVLSGVALMGAGIVCAGLAILSFFGCVAATKGSAWLTKQIVVWIKSCFVKRRDE